GCGSGDRVRRHSFPTRRFPISIRAARTCTGRARLEQTERKKRKKGGGGPRTTTPPVEYVARRKADLLSHPPSGVALSDLPELLADRKSTRLNSSHVKISYAVFC